MTRDDGPAGAPALRVEPITVGPIATHAYLVGDPATCRRGRPRRPPNMHIERIGDRPSTPGAAEYFTGRVRVDPLVRRTGARARDGRRHHPPGEKHRHGASPTVAMTHVAIQEALDGVAVAWLEHVSDEQYATP